ncbi:MAG: 50S ribosomal protein L24 [Candidatus Omnitrophota bacterium]
MIKIRRNDIVQSIKGKDRGKKGKVLKLFLAEKRALVEGLNMVKKHKRKTQTNQQGGIVSIEAPISIANLNLFCKQCNRPVRAGFMVLTDGTKTRICKVCKEVI